MKSFKHQPILNGRKISFDTDSQFTHLTRLCSDFDFEVFEVLRIDGDTPIKQVVLVTSDYRSIDNGAITPGFDSIKALEAHVKANMVDILHDYLFGFVEDDIQLSKKA